MKFFNWVHKRFHHTIPKDEFGQNVEKTEAGSNDKKVVLVDVLDGWKDGILSIGTFGFDPLKPFNQQKQYLALESEEDDEEESQEYSLDATSDEDDDDQETYSSVADEEVNPLIISSFGRSEKHVLLMGLDSVGLAPFSGSQDQLTTEQNSALQSDQKKGRTTLADLFLADADLKKKLDSDKGFPSEKLNVRSKKSLSFAKKFIPRVKEDTTSPIKNLQRLMKRVLKRKIHPEFDAKSQKSEAEKSAVAIELVTNRAKVSESVSLLAMQGATSEL
ncbi:hypothetical protein UlMin_021769 [Ulmus minor]